MARKVRDHVRPLPGIPGADVVVKLTTSRGDLLEYAVVLRVIEKGRHRPVRLYDYVEAHGEHHLHRYSREGTKHQPPEVLQYARVQDGFDAALQQIRASAAAMIESWRR